MTKKSSATASSETQKIAPGPSDPQNFWENPLGSFTALSQEYGDIVCLDPGTRQIYLINHPNDIKHILQDNYRNYTKDADTFKLIIGDGLIVSEGDLWLQQRRTLQPAFHRRNLEPMLNPMIDAVTDLIKDLQISSDPSFDLFSKMTELTINISASTMFGADIKDEIKPLIEAIAIAQEYVHYHSWDYDDRSEGGPSAARIQFDNAMSTIDRIVYGIINERRQNKQEKNDLLALLLYASDEKTGNRMSEKQLRDEAVTMLLAGQSTTAIALTWAWYTLASYPDVEQRMYAEIQQVIGDRTPTFEDLSNLTYTRMVIDEVLRLYPSSWLTARRSIKEDQVGGYHIPENAEVFISAYLVHRHPAFWKDPENFDPERFLPERAAERSHFAYLPFGAGPHVCIGNSFAISAIQLTIAMIEKGHRLQLVSQQKIGPQPQILLQPEDNILMTFQKR